MGQTMLEYDKCTEILFLGKTTTCKFSSKSDNV